MDVVQEPPTFSFVRACLSHQRLPEWWWLDIRNSLRVKPLKEPNSGDKVQSPMPTTITARMRQDEIPNAVETLIETRRLQGVRAKIIQIRG